MISDFDFYTLPRVASQRTRVIKKKTGSQVETYNIHTAEGVRHSDADDFSISVPSFASWKTVTYVKSSDGYWYTVERSDEDIRDRTKIRFDLSFDPFMTMFGGTAPPVKALWNKLPFASISAKRGTVLDESNLIESSKSGLSVMSWTDYSVSPSKEYPMVWVEITTTCELYGKITGSEPKSITRLTLPNEQEHAVVDQSSIWKYGFFACYDKGQSVPRIPVNYGHTVPGYEIKTFGGSEIQSIDIYYPGLSDIIHDPDELFGIPADAILDVSVSAWCPYRFRYYLQSGYTGQIPMLGAEGMAEPWYPYIIREGYASRQFDEYGRKQTDLIHVAFYELGRMGDNVIPRDVWDTHRLSISKDEYVCGEVNLRDANGNVIANIPRDYFVWNNATEKWDLDYKAQTYSDSTGLYTRVDIGKDTPHVITFPEGKLPYVGDAYTQYLIRDLSYDREALENTKEQAWLQFGAGVAESLVGGGMTMAMGRVGAASKNTLAGRNMATGMSVGGGIVSSALNTVLSIRAAEQEQELAEARQKGAAGTGYNTGYGISYCDNAFDIGAGFVVMMPSRFDPSMAHSQGEYYGYEAGFVGQIEFTVSDGYYEGVPVAQDPRWSVPGRYWDRFAEILMNGVRIIGV